MNYITLDLPSGDAVRITRSEVRDAITSSHLHCGWEVSRDGQAEPCGKPAVAIRYDEQNGALGEVCKHHTARVMVPLWYVVAVTQEPEGRES